MLLESVLEAEDARAEENLPRVADVLVPGALDHSYSYRVPAGLTLAAAHFGTVPLRTLETVLMAPEPGAFQPNIAFVEPLLDPAQADAADALRATIARGGFSTTLLEGVTGSGKTEVYFEAVAAALATGGQVLILMPEIALTGQFLDRFARRFG